VTEPTAAPKIVRKLVVIFDIAYSTAILEDLIRTENLDAWQKVLGQLKRFFWSEKIGRKQMYKFLGDGWILLFEDGELSGKQVLELLEKLSAKYEELFNLHVASVLSNMPPAIGLTFGIDEGSLVEIIMNNQREFVGRALNVAARLQGATKAMKEPAPGLLLISNNAFSRLELAVKHETVECDLANVVGGRRYRARKVRISEVEERAV
jgi:class 3 adenylate cyclase